ncbi:DUF2304 domain-containing protein [Catenulispora sp. NF23]|uniref:DUF2304 domain-containing protein n=1 Tax=Catenulispora pinistramenti TaxID=2705254 RepID=A0ABS5KQF4_9ACTN|nr:DUF2304 domain-containing protein [Catenulispora pinistramenti]MBS2533668.1 DUF2304 domain-containing protein [Catenulispora pinistramenti]MBS2548267.1 DUF2304 domain-containing protein [Catenulispora pinistramenti]
MVIQIILIATAVVLFVFFIRSSHSVRTQAFKRIGFVIFLFLSLDAVLRPNDTTWLAHKVGVGRGADLLLYMLVAAFAFFAVNTFLRFRNLERRFTDLARAIALRDAQAPTANRAPSGQAHATAQPPAFPAQAAREDTPEPETSLSGGSSR